MKSSVIVFVAPTCSTERTELFQYDDSRTATIDLKHRKRPPPNTPVPFADVEDDHPLTAATPTEVSNNWWNCWEQTECYCVH